MKNLLLLFCFALAYNMLLAQTDSSNINKVNSVKVIDTGALAKIYVIRSTGHVGSAVNLRVMVDDM